MPTKFTVPTLALAMSLAVGDDMSAAAHGLSPKPSTAISTAIPSTRVGARPDTTDEEGVRTALEQYRKALLERDGELASRTVDKKTFETYQHYLELARTVDRAGLDALDLMAKLAVLRLRHELGAARLAVATGREIFALGVDKGWVSDNSVRNADIAKIAIDHTSASVSISAAPHVPIFFFFKEGDGWKFALWKTIAMAEPALQAMMAESGETDEVAYVVGLIEAISQRKFDRALLNGPPAGLPQSANIPP